MSEPSPEAKELVAKIRYWAMSLPEHPKWKWLRDEMLECDHQQPSATVRTHDFGEVYIGKQPSAITTNEQAYRDGTISRVKEGETTTTQKGDKQESDIIR